MTAARASLRRRRGNSPAHAACSASETMMSNDPARSSAHAFPTRVTDMIRTEVTIESESHFFTGLGGDATRGGLFIATYRDAAVGQKLLVEIQIDGDSIVAPGTVRWRTPGSSDLPPGIGLTLHELSERDRGTIQRFCAK